MAHSTLDDLVAGYQTPWFSFRVGATMEAAGVLYTPIYAPGFPGAAVAPTPGLAGAALTAYDGLVPFANPGVGDEARLCRVGFAATQACAMQTIDRLWHNSGIVVTTTTAQTVNSVAFPARDRDGSTNGVGVMVAIEVSTATTNGSAVTNTTLSYTNSAGVAGRTATIASFPATALVGTFVPFNLQAGDIGVRSIQSVTLGTSYGAGAVHLVAYRILDPLMGISAANVGNLSDFVGTGFVRCFDNTVIQPVILPNVTTATTFHFCYQWSHN